MKVADRMLQLAAETPEDRDFGGKLERQWKLGQEIDENAIQAKLELGVLELTLPKKAPEEVEPRTIEIN